MERKAFHVCLLALLLVLPACGHAVNLYALGIPGNNASDKNPTPASSTSAVRLPTQLGISAQANLQQGICSISTAIFSPGTPTETWRSPRAAHQ